MGNSDYHHYHVIGIIIMYVCICNAVTDRQIRTAVQEGHRTFEKIQQQLDVGTCCGQCEPHAKEVILEAKNNALKTKVSSSSITFNPFPGLASF
jgi:bacterioferritin-associated ferredoxin